jgi:hemerythrin superfamily protein
MNAIDLLESQHREVEDLFARIEKAANNEAKEQAFIELADSLAIHATIEEHHFYPAVKESETEEILVESVEEHLEIKRKLSALLDTEIEDETFDAKVDALRDEVERHVEEEEEDLFPKVMNLFDEDQLEAIGQAMSAEQGELEEKGNPRNAVPSETESPASI